MCSKYSQRTKSRPSSKDINLLLENCLDSLLALASEVGGCLRDSAQSESPTLRGNLLCKTGSCPVDGVAANFLPCFISTVSKLVLRSVVGESLHNVGSSSEEFPMQ